MRFLIACILAFLPLTANAKWLEASSTHFVVYSDDSESNIRRFSENLEKYHSALAFLLQERNPPPSPSNRVTVYIVNTARDVRKLHGNTNKYVGGFYVPRAGGSVAIIPQVTAASGPVNWSMTVLLHEYAHHFMAINNNFPLPRWMSEGGAEFFASASFDMNGGIGLGRPALHRASELHISRDVKAEALLDPAVYEQQKKSGYDAFYGKSWLLYHYLTFDEARQGQFSKYARLLTEGVEQREAALSAFGSFEQLEKELDKYMRRQNMTMISLKPEILKTGPVTIRELREGEAAIMPVRIQSRAGVRLEDAPAIAAEARKIAARYPKDPAVLTALAEAEHDAQNNKEAIAAADAAIAIDPKQVDAYVQKGLALFRIAYDAEDKEAAYSAARQPFIELNRLENDHPVPLIYFYLSYYNQGKAPPPVAIHGLKRATELAPFDRSVRMSLANALLKEGKGETAILILKPVAYSPHGGYLAERAAGMIARIEKEPEWRGDDAKILRKGPDENDEDGES